MPRTPGPEGQPVAGGERPRGLLSYAQNFEDVRLWRALASVRNGRYLDIGAQHPITDSVSLAFYVAGWRGVHVEPVPHFARLLRENRPDEEVIEAAVSSKAGSMTIHAIGETGLSTGVPAIARQHRLAGHSSEAIKVRTVRLDTLLDRFANNDLHWLKIDVEGMELDVLESWGDSPVRPWVLVVESTNPNSQVETDSVWRGEVERRGYQEVAFDGLSRFFISAEMAELGSVLSPAPSVFDAFRVAAGHWSASWLANEAAARIESVEAEAARLAGQAEHLAAESGELRLALANREGQIVGAEAAKSAQEASIAAINARNGQLQNELIEARQSLGLASTQLARQIAENGQLEQGLAAALARSEQLDAKVAQLLADLARQQGDLAKANAARVQAEALKDQGARHEAVLLQQLDQAQAREQQAATVTGALAGQLGQLTEIVKTQAQQVTDRDSRLAMLQAVETALNRDLSRQVARIADLATELASLESQLQRWPHRVASFFGAHFANPKNGIAGSPEAGTRTADYAEADRAPLVATPVLADRASTMSLFQNLPANPYLRADSLAALCSFADLDFVRCAYVTILGRQPDAAGETYYATRLRAGTDKLTILGQLRFSSEGSSHDPGIAGLDRILRRHRNANRPLIGWLIRLFTYQRGETTLERSIRSVQNELGVVSSRMTEGFLHINHMIHEMNLQVLAVRAGSRSASDDGAARFGSYTASSEVAEVPADAFAAEPAAQAGNSEWRLGITRALRP